MKKKVKMKDLGKQHSKDFLTDRYPFLRNEFRVLKPNELKSEKVLKELFGDEETDLFKLSVIYAFQN